MGQRTNRCWQKAQHLCGHFFQVIMWLPLSHLRKYWCQRWTQQTLRSKVKWQGGHVNSVWDSGGGQRQWNTTMEKTRSQGQERVPAETKWHPLSVGSSCKHGWIACSAVWSVGWLRALCGSSAKNTLTLATQDWETAPTSHGPSLVIANYRVFMCTYLTSNHFSLHNE